MSIIDEAEEEEEEDEGNILSAQAQEWLLTALSNKSFGNSSGESSSTDIEEFR